MTYLKTLARIRPGSWVIVNPQELTDINQCLTGTN